MSHGPRRMVHGVTVTVASHHHWISATMVRGSHRAMAVTVAVARSVHRMCSMHGCETVGQNNHEGARLLEN